MKIKTFTTMIILIVVVILVYINLQLCRFRSTATNYITSSSDIHRIITVPEEIIVEEGKSIRLIAMAVNKFDRILNQYYFDWSVEDTLMGVLERTDIFTGNAPGVTSAVVKTHDGKMEKTIPIIVVPEDMVYIPEGTFIMGGGEDKPSNEQPLREINLGGYFIDKYEVTNEKFSAFLNITDNMFFDERMEIIQQNGKFKSITGREHFPVAFVSWIAANAYSKWLGKRLPTEAEWERAARGDKDNRDFPLVVGLTGRKANYRDSGDPFDNGTTSVGFYNGRIYQGFETKRYTSLHGVFDICGNLSEWVADWYDKNYYRKSPTINPKGPSETVERTIRGGSWFDIPKRLRVSYRTSGHPELKNKMVGFRCAKSL